MFKRNQHHLGHPGPDTPLWPLGLLEPSCETKECEHTLCLQSEEGKQPGHRLCSPVPRFPRITALTSESIIVPTTGAVRGMGVRRPSCWDCRADSTSYDKDPG